MCEVLVKRLVELLPEQGGSVLVVTHELPTSPVLSAHTGAFIASVAAEANFKVSMTWRGGTAKT